tara:strand:- start:1639 stop:2694 length:1056 start_codon:yes stop_codon:yes gene_type:complete
MTFNRLIRSPQNLTVSSSNSSVKSVRLNITLNGGSTPTYSLIVNASANENINFEYAELVRDYLDLELGSSGTPSTIPAFTILLAVSFWDNVNPSAGGATQLGSTANTTVYGFDGYGTFAEDYNPDMSEIAFPAISNFDWGGSSSSGTKVYTVYAPKDSALVIPSIVNHQVVYTSSGINATSMTVEGVTINIERVHCTKYTDENSGYWSSVDVTGFRVYFINKYGAIQTEFFTLKAVEKISSKRSNYNSNIVEYNGNYDVNKHTKRDFDITGQQSITLSSFFVPEYYNKVFTEMLLSEKVWVRMREPYTGNFTNIPINIKDTGFEYKNVTNDKLISFTFNFDMSFDYINNIR